MDTLKLSSLDIDLTKVCNMNCSYCYLSHGERQSGDIEDATLLKAIELMKRYGQTVTRPNAKSPGGRQTTPPTIHFYGGEPMMRFGKIRFMVEEAKKAGVALKFVIFTNGTVGTEEDARFCQEHKIHLVRGINGCKSAQDVERPNSYEKYKEMTKRFKDEKGHRRMTTTPATAKYIAQSVKEFVEEGSSGATPMPDYYADWTPEATKEYLDQTRKVAEYFVERWKIGKPFYSYFLSKEAACRFSNLKSIVYCSAGKSLHCLSMDGYLMMCHRFVGEKKDGPFCFGHIDEILAGTAKGYGEIVKDRLADCHAQKRPNECMSCKGRAGCEQGCHHSNYITTGDMGKPSDFYCEIHRGVAEIVDWIDSQLRPLDAEWWIKNNIRSEVQMYLNRRKHEQTASTRHDFKPSSPTETNPR